MSYGETLARVWRDNRLFSALIELTYRCNLDCFFCYNNRKLPGVPLSYSDYERLFADLRAMETLDLTFSGGEPLVHPDFYRLGALARRLGFVVRVKSNGHVLTEKLARRLLEEVDPFVVEVSLHGASAPVHDRQTRIPGSFEVLLRNLATMRTLGLRVRINSTLTAWNEHELEAMFALADRLGVAIHFDAQVTPRDDGDREPQNIRASDAGIGRLYRLLRERTQAAGASAPAPASSPRGNRHKDAESAPSPEKHCGTGSAGVTIDPYGNVYPCIQWREPAGNLQRQSIREIWETSPVLERARSASREAYRMLENAGPASRMAGFCPALARELTGSPLRWYEGVERRRRALESLGE